jgi:hypothetical protein
MRAVWIVIAVACSSTPHDPKPPAPADAARVALDVAAVQASPDVERAACDLPHATDWRPVGTVLERGRIVHVRVASAKPGPQWGSDRCVALDLEVLGVFRGEEATGEHVKLVIRQSMIEHVRARPGGAWWIGEQTLEQGLEYVAFCPAGPLAISLRGSCGVTSAKPLLQDLRFVRDAEAAKLPLSTVLAQFKAECATASHVAPAYLWEKFGESAARDVAIYDAFATVVEEPSCSYTSRATLFNSFYSVSMAESAPHIRRLVRAMFRLLDVVEAAGMHDNLIGTWLPNALGIVGGMKKWTAAEIFGGAPALRAAATKALAAYQGTADAKALRAWLARP